MACVGEGRSHLPQGTGIAMETLMFPKKMQNTVRTKENLWGGTSIVILKSDTARRVVSEVVISGTFRPPANCNRMSVGSPIPHCIAKPIHEFPRQKEV